MVEVKDKNTRYDDSTFLNIIAGCMSTEPRQKCIRQSGTIENIYHSSPYISINNVNHMIVRH